MEKKFELAKDIIIVGFYHLLLILLRKPKEGVLLDNKYWKGNSINLESS